MRISPSSVRIPSTATNIKGAYLPIPANPAPHKVSQQLCGSAATSQERSTLFLYMLCHKAPHWTQQYLKACLFLSPYLNFTRSSAWLKITIKSKRGGISALYIVKNFPSLLFFPYRYRYSWGIRSKVFCGKTLRQLKLYA